MPRVMLFMKLGKVFILGDSYSTFEKCVPEGYAVWYRKDIVNDTDVNSVEHTWWKQLINSTDSEILLNCSWSGTTICHTGYGGDCSDKSFIARFDRLAEEGYFEKNNVDTLFVFGGTNDSWCGAPLGEIKKDNWINDDLYNILPAIYCFFDLLKKALPNAEIYCLINTGLKKEVADSLKDAAQIHNITPIVFDKIDKQCGHPTIQGMKDIKTAVLKALK